MKFVIIIFLAFVTLDAFGQNLLQNSSFEVRPRIGNLLGAYPWKIVGFSPSPDIITKPVIKNEGISIKPHSGKSYLGLATFKLSDSSDKSEVEMVFQELSTNLLKEKLYCIQVFYAMRGSYYSEGYRSIGCYISKDKVKIRDHKLVGTCSPVELTSSSGDWLNSLTWSRISGVYRANGNERYITLGIFDFDSRYFGTSSDKRPYGRISYYYLDDIKMWPIDDSSECPCFHRHRQLVFDNKDNEPKIEDREILNDVHFDFNSNQLFDSSKIELSRIAEFLLNNGEISLEIHGHTDSVGVDSYNVWLSIERAKSVFDYLTKCGVPEERLSYFGHGSSIPDKRGVRTRRVELLIR